MKMEDEEKVEQDEEKMTAADQEQLDQEPAERVTSTRELAKDLERKPSGKADHPANAALFPENESRDFHKRWTDIQTAFVDEPRQAVERFGRIEHEKPAFRDGGVDRHRDAMQLLRDAEIGLELQFTNYRAF